MKYTLPSQTPIPLQYQTVYQAAPTPPNLPPESIGVPIGWILAPTPATAINNIFQAIGNRPEGSPNSIPYVYTELSVYEPKLSAAPLEYQTVYQAAATPPNLPTTSIGVPIGWLLAPTPATTINNIFQAIGNRPEGSPNSVPYVYTELSIYQPKLSAAPLEYQTVYQAAATPPNLPTTSIGVPIGWLLAPTPATTINNIFQAIGNRPEGSPNSVPYVYTELSIYQPKLSAAPLEYQTVYQAAATPPNLPTTSIGVPIGWLLAPPAATETSNVFQATGNRPEGSLVSIPYVYTELSIYEPKLSADPLEYQTVYQATPTPPNLPPESIGIPTGWLLAPTPATTTNNIFQAIGSRPEGSDSSVAYVYTELSVYQPKLSPAQRTQSAYWNRSALTTNADSTDSPSNRTNPNHLPTFDGVIATSSPQPPTPQRLFQWIATRTWSTDQSLSTAWLLRRIIKEYQAPDLILPIFTNPGVPTAINFVVTESGTHTLPNATISSGETLVFSLSPAPPSGLSFNSLSRQLSGTPDLVGGTIHILTATVSGTTRSASIGVYINVNPLPPEQDDPIDDQ